jgi:hypothetical protein
MLENGMSIAKIVSTIEGEARQAALEKRTHVKRTAIGAASRFAETTMDPAETDQEMVELVQNAIIFDMEIMQRVRDGIPVESGLIEAHFMPMVASFQKLDGRLTRVEDIFAAAKTAEDNKE